MHNLFVDGIVMCYTMFSTGVVNYVLMYKYRSKKLKITLDIVDVKGYS